MTSEHPTPATDVGTDLDAWRRAQLADLLHFGGASLRADGAAQWLDDAGQPDRGQPVHTWITSRMAHVYAFASLLGAPGAGELADRALHGLRAVLVDATYGGWVASRGPAARPGDVDRSEEGPVDGTKSAYAHAFVVLAAASGTIAGRDGARELLDAALAVLDERFWEPGENLHVDEWSRDWSALDEYRGVNANMHSVEALLAAHDATGDARWLDRAASIADRVIGWAATNDWRIPEHFDTSWNPLPEFNADRPRDPFKPYGSTPGHGLEWARLLLQVDVAAGTPGARTDAAVALFDRAVADGWDGEHGGGFVYTVDWSGAPVEPRRYHWVAAEAAAAADVLGRVTGEERYAELAAGWWAWIDANLVDHERGSWHHELDTANRPDGVTWVGKPDVYHAAQAVILPDLPLTGSLAASAKAAGRILG
ncbi:AGE family epimerase/isomerase [Cellulosimicrobium arenosum]|uniref:AGE family epimerase/isomerase n=1 Tax=Cellulosimicrobium arenosum TaxID=2708133 RepID=A0A927G8M4_9MICO|nr:AGE family epimerase/isomerase [Cellulosimicrobium arenosum]MBD8078695.1 AGE family epimerase/isomerase [Cellulosimicrobium arenosum]